MALILNKTLTDSEGNLNNLSYTDPSGNIHENPYLVVDNIFINKLNNVAKLYYSIYKNSDARTNKNKSVYDSYALIDNTSLFNQYFITNDYNGFKQSYIYISEKVFTNWVSDEV